MAESAATEVWFYHLERTGLDQALPELLEKTLQRGWRAVVRGVAPSGWLAKRGPGMDPDGITGGTVPSGGSGSSVRSGNGELGPGIDPNG